MKKLFISMLLFATSAEAAVQYEDVYPQYTELCTLSQRKKRDIPSEGPWGHIMMFIRGACLSPDRTYPRLVSCTPSADNTVMVSLNSLAKNVHWIASQGEKFGFHGTLGPNETLTQKQFDAAVDYIVNSGVYKGVQLHEDELEEPGGTVPPVVQAARTSVDIDTAITYGRDVVCARMPLPDSAKNQLIDSLNAMNDYYALNPERTFQWNYIYNNCAHLVHNSLAALGLWEPKKTNQSTPVQLFNLAIPANELVDFVSLVESTNFDDPLKIFKNSGWRESLMQKQWLPLGHGVVIRALKRHTPNDLYDGDLNTFVFDAPLSFRNRGLFHRYSTDPRYQDVEANLSDYQAKYTRALQNLKPEAYYLKSISKPEERRVFSEFYPVYKAFLTAQLNDVIEKAHDIKNP